MHIAPPRLTLRHIALVLVTLFAAGCGEDNPAGNVPGPGAVSLSRSVVTVYPESIAPGAFSTLTLLTRDDTGAAITSGGRTVAFAASGGSSQGAIGATTDHGDGTYTARFTAATEGTPTTIGATVDGSTVTSTLPSLTVSAQPVLTDTTASIALIDMQGYSYKSFPGLLYPGSNDCPAAHVARQPQVDTSQPFVLLSIGFSNCKMEFCDPISQRDVSYGGQIGPQGCATYSFIGQAWGDAILNDNLVLVNGGIGGRVATDWDSPSDPAYGFVQGWLQQAGRTEADVEVIWCKMANLDPTVGLPNANADAFDLLGKWGDVARALKTTYPNVKQVYLATRIWSCSQGGPSDEPFAYETGFAVKWLIEAQIEQLATGSIDPIAGDLGLGVAPWLAWGPYMWADGGNANSQGLTWSPSELNPDCAHPAVPARTKIGTMLYDFFRTSPLTTPWFLD